MMFGRIQDRGSPIVSTAGGATVTTTLNQPFNDETIPHDPLQPGPATGGRIFRGDEEWSKIVFQFVPNPSKPVDFQYQDWVATLEIKCRDVPRLMREGIYWDASNIINEGGYLKWGDVTRDASVRGQAHTRSYCLVDNYLPPRWVASLSVKSLISDIISDFCVDQLSKELIKHGWARSQDGKQIYGYDAPTCADTPTNAAANPGGGFNAIYDEMPMEGFWPWPPREDKPHADCDGQADVEDVASESWETSIFQHEAGKNEGFIDIEAETNSEKWVLLGEEE